MVGRRLWAWILLWLGLMAGPGTLGSVRAELSDTIALIKPSVVAVGSYLPTRAPSFRFIGTGFVVGNGRQVASNAHLLSDLALEDNEILVIALPSGGRAVLRPVRKEALDGERDLLLLGFEGAPLPALKLGDSNLVRDGREVALTGFPLGASLGLVPVTHRGIVSAITPISQPLDSSRQLDGRAIRRLTAGNFPVFQLDMTVYPGNSGSPLYDPATGEVLGILNQVFIKGLKETAITHPSGIAYAIPIAHLKSLLAR